ncbi:unnamed protein product [Lymnaea stagnalis]|uniref:Syntaxin-binding protein 1 n=1 Tax=Lymnaea stagnalis TaxID=6523 RepID=A0AAV2HSI2_LYMST
MVLKAAVRENILKELRLIKKKKEWKVLILDSFCTQILNKSCAMYDIVSEGITLVEDLYKKREPLPLLEAVYFITPNEKSITALTNDFRDPTKSLYKAAHVFFNEACPDELFNLLCKARVAKFLKTLKEMYVSFYPMESQVYSLDSPEVFKFYYSPNKSSQHVTNLDRCADQIATLCVTLGEYPTVRYRSAFKQNEEFAKLIKEKLDFYKKDDNKMGVGHQKENSILLVLDRGFDPISPLLHELTFQAMAYDLLPIVNDIYKYSNSSGDETEEKQCRLDEKDSLWVELRHKHIAIVLQEVSKKLKQFAETRAMKTSEKPSIRDLNQMIKAAPEYQRELSKFAAHSALAEECMHLYSTQVEKLCKVEQDQAMDVDGNGEKIKDHLKNIRGILLDETITTFDKIRIILLHVICQAGMSKENLNKLAERALIPKEEECIILNTQNLDVPITEKKQEKLLSYLPINRTPRDSEDTFVTSRWVPYLTDIIEAITSDDKAKSENFPPMLTNSETATTEAVRPDKPSRQISARHKSADKKKKRSRLFVFIVGGVTYSEIRGAYTFTEASEDWEVVIGSTHILTPEGFLHDLRSLSETEPTPLSDALVNPQTQFTAVDLA